MPEPRDLEKNFLQPNHPVSVFFLIIRMAFALTLVITVTKRARKRAIVTYDFYDCQLLHASASSLNTKKTLNPKPLAQARECFLKFWSLSDAKRKPAAGQDLMG